MNGNPSLFTPEMAREYQRASVLARRRNKLAALVTPKEDDITIAVKRQIADVLADMERTRSRKEKARLTLMLERLWNLVYPRAGARKPGRGDYRKPLPPMAQDSWTPAHEVATPLATELNDKPNTQ